MTTDSSPDGSKPPQVRKWLTFAAVAAAWTTLMSGGAFAAAVLTQFCAFAECSQPNVVLGAATGTAVGLLWAGGLAGTATLMGLLPHRHLAASAAGSLSIALLFGSMFSAAGINGNGTNYYPQSGDLPEDQLIELATQLTVGMRTTAAALLVVAALLVWRHRRPSKHPESGRSGD